MASLCKQTKLYGIIAEKQKYKQLKKQLNKFFE